MTILSRTGIVASATLTGLAGLHAYWARGGYWPGHDAESLGEAVVGPDAELPPVWAVWGVVGLLGTSAAAVAVTSTGRETPFPVREMTWATGAALVARGAIGLPISLTRGRATRFGQLDATLYSPLCLALGATAIAVAHEA